MEVKNLNHPVFLSTETYTHFILSSNLEGYELKKITTMIKEATTDGGEKRTRRWLRVSVVVDTTSGVNRFRKFFWIPDGVVSDEIKTKLIEEESVLRILMPKSAKGISGVGIEEVKEEEIGIERQRKTAPESDKVPETENPRNNEQEQEEEKQASDLTITHQESTPAKEDADLKAKYEAAEARADQFEEYIAHAQLKSEQERDRTESLKPDHSEEVQLVGNEVPVESKGVEPSREKHDGGKGFLGKGFLGPSRRSKLIKPCLFAGSAILLSLVLVIRF